MKIESFSVPILFIIFNRPDTTQHVFEKIRAVRPSKLFIASDAPRYVIQKEPLLCEQVLEIATQVDWDCEVKILQQSHNLGVGRGGAAAITWFFEHVDAGIILEDDCVPSNDFFKFCQYGLAKYRYNNAVMMIAGTSYLKPLEQESIGCYFSRYYQIWGWATWRRAWALYSYDISQWRSYTDRQLLEKFWGNKKIAKRWTTIFDSIAMGKLEAWDVQWVYACFKNKGLSLSIPNNMISNIGILGGHANGTKSFDHEMPYGSCDITKYLDYVLPEALARRLDLETYRINGFFKQEPCIAKIKRVITRKIPLVKEVYSFLKYHWNK